METTLRFALIRMRLNRDRAGAVRLSITGKQPARRNRAVVAMSRSRRRYPARGITSCDSEKQDKRIANGVLRMMCRAALANCAEYDALVFPSMREALDAWSMGKDGKFRFDPARYPELMRK